MNHFHSVCTIYSVEKYPGLTLSTVVFHDLVKKQIMCESIEAIPNSIQEKLQLRQTMGHAFLSAQDMIILANIVKNQQGLKIQHI
jgi:hypothetical protein